MKPVIIIVISFVLLIPNIIFAEDIEPTCETLVDDKKELQKQYGTYEVTHDEPLRLEILEQIKDLTYQIKKLCPEIKPNFTVCDSEGNCKNLKPEPEPELEPVLTADDQYKMICSAPDSYCMSIFGMNNPDSYGECLGKWVPFCRTYEAKQPEPEPEISQEKYFVTPLPIVCGKGTVLIDHICQVDKIEEKEIPVEKTIEKEVDIPVEKPSKKSVNWFSSIFDWFGGLFK